jgi:hypothetical protein
VSCRENANQSAGSIAFEFVGSHYFTLGFHPARVVGLEELFPVYINPKLAPFPGQLVL